MADQMQDPTMQGAQVLGGEGGEIEEAGQGFTICIKVGPDGSIMVGTEPYTEEGGEDESGLSPVGNIKEAMSVALDIYKNQGQVIDATEGEDEFNAGFAPKSSGRPGAPTM